MRTSTSPCDETGAVFVEKLIVYLPLLLAFFSAWELAELAAASIVVQRASATAGRAAVVVLPDDPSFYAGEDLHEYGGLRRADIELAAGMILSAVPRFSDSFMVDVTDPPTGPGTVDVSVEAEYDCGLVSPVCGSDSTVTLSSTTTHTYHGAHYPYSSLDLGSATGALTESGDSFRAETAAWSA